MVPMHFVAMDLSGCTGPMTIPDAKSSSKIEKNGNNVINRSRGMWLRVVSFYENSKEPPNLQYSVSKDGMLEIKEPGKKRTVKPFKSTDDCWWVLFLGS